MLYCDINTLCRNVCVSSGQCVNYICTHTSLHIKILRSVSRIVLIHLIVESVDLMYEMSKTSLTSSEKSAFPSVN